MSEETPDGNTAPGAGAGDAAPTQEVPHLPKPAATSTRSPAKKSAASQSVLSGGMTATASDETGTAESVTDKTVTDKGRPRPEPAEKPAQHTSPTTPPAEESDAPEQKRRVKPVGRSLGQPLTAANYAKTTRPSPSTTSVMPAVKDTATREVTTEPAAASGRQANLRLMHVEPWSVTRLAFAISVAMMIVSVVSVAIFWVVLDKTGVWEQINGAITSVLSDDSSSFDITDYLGFGRLVGLALVLSAINVILMTALATIGAHLYNTAAQLLGGLEVRFAEEK